MNVPLSLTSKSLAEVGTFVQSYNKRLCLQKETVFSRLSGSCTAAHPCHFSLQFFLALGQTVL